MIEDGFLGVLASNGFNKDRVGRGRALIVTKM
jgi:hypothetical protein